MCTCGTKESVEQGGAAPDVRWETWHRNKSFCPADLFFCSHPLNLPDRFRGWSFKVMSGTRVFPYCTSWRHLEPDSVRQWSWCRSCAVTLLVWAMSHSPTWQRQGLGLQVNRVLQDRLEHLSLCASSFDLTCRPSEAIWGSASYPREFQECRDWTSRGSNHQPCG